MWLDWSKTAKHFSVNSCRKFLSWHKASRQVGEQARENWVVNEVAGRKIAFSIIFDPTWTHILASKGPNMEFLKQNFNFQSLRKTEAILLPGMWLKDWLTKNLLNNHFSLFLTQNGEKFSSNFLQIWYF